MLDINYNGQIAVIDLRKNILKGEHPKSEVMEFAKKAEKGTILELHLPHAAQPLAAALEGIGYPAVTHQLGPDHFRMMCVIMDK
ncbi:DUF2249 domain-containing protein [Paenibacillus zeisoli]|uniref:DUF2249 domain-containing protein n=1 Tax=Paenibacillus zeisoli TaxID=2496267 RepID=A0A3S1D9F3_9BACL|nr:DUF2249 domain-containing protein [Paenibacillus zeisoli]RUT35722.1 DUF2249 domain-containing protein [Paenibacillus zeisoli]